jgi:hypothetical protein
LTNESNKTDYDAVVVCSWMSAVERLFQEVLARQLSMLMKELRVVRGGCTITD